VAPQRQCVPPEKGQVDRAAGRGKRVSPVLHSPSLRWTAGAEGDRRSGGARSTSGSGDRRGGGPPGSGEHLPLPHPSLCESAWSVACGWTDRAMPGWVQGGGSGTLFRETI
jgi:hypothetical protein